MNSQLSIIKNNQLCIFLNTAGRCCEVKLLKRVSTYVFLNYVTAILANSSPCTNSSHLGDFPGGLVVKNPSANAGDMVLIPGLGRSHMLWSN